MQGQAGNRTIIMKTKIALFTPLLAISLAMTLAAASLTQTIANINADAKKDPAKAAQSVSASTKVPVATLEKEKAKTNMSYGDLFAAHSIAKTSGKSFDEVAALKAKGQNWTQISESLGVSMSGDKNTAMQPTAKASPTATPPAKSLSQEQRDRYK